MKLGILGAGGIASTMAKTVAGMKDVGRMRLLLVIWNVPGYLHRNMK